jgi:hypothetical protein
MAANGDRVNVILTAYLTAGIDPQRGYRWTLDAMPLTPLLDSLTAPVVIFADELDAPNVVRVPRGQSVFFDRWRHIANYLAEHDEIGYCFAVDATDVQMLHDPFPHMEAGKLYCGSEPKDIGFEWMYYHHPQMWRWIYDNAARPLLNCGLVGGDRETMLRMARRMGEERRGMTMDMGAFNFLAYTEFDVVTGPLVHTLYKANETDSAAWFRHK